MACATFPGTRHAFQKGCGTVVRRGKGLIPRKGFFSGSIATVATGESRILVGTWAFAMCFHFPPSAPLGFIYLIQFIYRSFPWQHGLRAVHSS